MTSKQMQYLLALTSTENGRQTLSSVANIYGVNRSTVSRSMSVFIDKGIINENYELTMYGARFVHEYRKKYEQINCWLKNNGISDIDAEQDAYAIMENCSDDTNRLIGQMGSMDKSCSAIGKKYDNKILRGEELAAYFEEGQYNIPFVFTKIRSKLPDIQVSMANRGFVHPAVLTVNKNSTNLCLRVKDIRRKGISEKIELKGRVNSIKYEKDGKRENAIFVDKKVYIPGDALTYTYIKEDNILRGSVVLTMSCSVGTIHMPESSALLYLYCNR